MAKKTPRGYEIRIRVGKGKRLETNLPGSLTQTQADAREQLIEELADLLRLLNHANASREMLRELALATNTEEARAVEKNIRRFLREPKKADPEKVSGVTFGDFAMQWADGRLHLEYPRYVPARTDKTMKIDKKRVRHLSKTIGQVKLAKFTNADAQRALDALPKDLKGTSVRHYAQVIQTVVRKAMVAGHIAATAYPLPVVGFLPKIDAPPSYPILYPKDDATLLACADLPVWRRVLYGFAAREGMRVSHIFRLRWLNIDFENGMITVGVGKNNKNARTWELNQGVAAALAWYRTTKPGTPTDSDLIFPALTEEEIRHLAEDLRNDLVKAGVTRQQRPDLFMSGDGQEPIRFQDLRATFVSLHLAQGWSYQDVMIRTQHTSTKVLEHHYARRVDVAKVIIRKQGPLLPLDRALGVEVGVVPEPPRGTSKKAARPEGFEPSTRRIRKPPARKPVPRDAEISRAKRRVAARTDVYPQGGKGRLGVNRVGGEN